MHEYRNNQRTKYDVEKPINKSNTSGKNKFKDTRLERESDGCTHQCGDHPEPKKCDRCKRLTSEKKRTSEPKNKSEKKMALLQLQEV